MQEQDTDPATKERGLYKRLDIAMRCIDREDNLRHQRLSWALQVNLAIIAFIFLYPDEGQAGIGEQQQIIIGAIVGLVFTAISLGAVLDAKKQIDYLRRFVETYLRDEFGDSDPERNFAASKFPRPYGESTGFKFGAYAPFLYCLIFGLAWLAVLVRAF